MIDNVSFEINNMKLTLTDPYEIHSAHGYPSNTLSNYYPHSFIFDGIEVYGMEGLLQSFKTDNITIQREMCKLSGRTAYYAGKKFNWYTSQTLYWNGQSFPRLSEEYQLLLLDQAYAALSTNPTFCKALLDTDQVTLIHSIGETDPTKTILTRDEFCSRLMSIRVQLQFSDIFIS